MSAEAFNELIQWLSILGIILLVLAVYRRLGMIYYDARGLRLAQFGGAVGAVDKKIRPAVFNGLTGSAGPMLLVFTTNGCSICSHIIEHLSGWAAILSGQLHLVIAAQGPLAYRREIESRVPMARVVSIEDVRHSYGSAPSSFPFSMLVDQHDRVVSKELGDEFEALIAAYEDLQADDVDRSARPATNRDQ